MTTQGETPVRESFFNDQQLLVTPEEAARRLSVGRTTVYELMSTGLLQSVSIGRCRRVPVSSLALFVNGLIGKDDGEREANGGLSAQPRASI